MLVLDPFLVFTELALHVVDDGIHGRFKGLAHLSGDQGIPRDVEFHFHDLVPDLTRILQLEKDLGIDYTVKKLVKFVGLSINVIRQLLVCVKMNGCEVNLHIPRWFIVLTKWRLRACILFSLRGRMGFPVNIHQPGHRIMGIHLGRRKTGMTQKFLDRIQLRTMVQ